MGLDLISFLGQVGLHVEGGDPKSWSWARVRLCAGHAGSPLDQGRGDDDEDDHNHDDDGVDDHNLDGKEAGEENVKGDDIWPGCGNKDENFADDPPGLEREEEAGWEYSWAKKANKNIFGHSKARKL